MEIVFRPLPGWPKAFTNPRHKADFAPDFNKTLQLLSRELRLLKCGGVVIQTAHTEKEISKTLGRPLADRQPAHPGVIVLADTPHGALSWPCDRFKLWIHNIRNVALYMERQRLLAASGVGEGNEAYKGHKMLPGPITGGGPTMTIEAAARLVASAAAPLVDHIKDAVLRAKARQVGTLSILDDREVYGELYRLAARQLHPDVAKDATKWQQLQDAITLLDSYHQGRQK